MRAMIRGSMPALVTPFKNGELDLDTLKSLVEWQIAEGSHGIVPVGTTGESPTLSHEEHETVIEEVVKAVAGRVPVIAGAGSNNTVEGIRLIQHAERVGADAALVVTPYYNKPTQAGLIAHYTALHDCCTLPIVIYNIPGRSVVDMLPDTMGTLARLPRIIGVKDATGKIERVSMQRAAAAPISSSCRARMRPRSASTPTAARAASASRRTWPPSSAPSFRRRRWPATTRPRWNTRTG
jgi:4-hydroxy-tetrahydrodipicolinate synthase